MIIAKAGIARMLAVIMISATLMNVFSLYAGADEERAMAVDKISCLDDFSRCAGIMATGGCSVLACVGLPSALRKGKMSVSGMILSGIQIGILSCMCRTLYRSITNGDRDPALAGVASKKMGFFDAFSRACGCIATGMMTGAAALITVGCGVLMNGGPDSGVPRDVARNGTIFWGIATVLCGYNCRALARNANGDNEIE